VKHRPVMIDKRNGRPFPRGWRNEGSKRAMTIHGGNGTRLYKIWDNMIGRCERQSARNYRRYGGRGISVCSEWRSSFASFQAWSLSSGYSDDLTIDRIDNDGNYNPSNCRWLTKHDNSSRAAKAQQAKVRNLTPARVTSVVPPPLHPRRFLRCASRMRHRLPLAVWWRVLRGADTSACRLQGIWKL
jgi:hypothetical protein